MNGNASARWYMRMAVFFGMAASIVGQSPLGVGGDLSGDWSGDLNPLLQVLVHLKASGNGYTATTDSPKQGSKGFGTEVSILGSKITLKIATPEPATFEGTVSGNQITGVFTQGGSKTPLTLSKAVAQAPPGKAAAAGDWSGDWSGDLNPQLQVLVHLKASGNGYTATTDSPKQGSKGFGTEVSILGSKITLKIATPEPATFEGTVSGNQITGVFTQGGSKTPLTLSKAVAQAPPGKAAAAGDWSGDWSGDLNPQLQVLVHLKASGNGYTATTDSPKQGSKGFGTEVSILGSKITLKIATPEPATFEGTVSGNQITGTFSQGSSSMPLTLRRQ